MVADSTVRPPKLPPFPAAPPLRDPPLLTIIINNHNYGRFVRRAIESALAQRGTDIEIIVVDDGSTDDSEAVISGYGDRVQVIRQENLGQKAAFNRGFEQSTGDFVLFLDADDELAVDTAAGVLAIVTAHPDTVRVVFRLSVVDHRDQPTGQFLPDARMPLPDGDLRPQVLLFPDDVPWPPTSGNVFAAWALGHIMPLAVDDERTGADHDLHTLVPLFGPVRALTRPGGVYRVHGGNAHARSRYDVQRSRLILRRTQRSHAELSRLARELGLPEPKPLSVTVAAHRLLSIRLGDGHPIPGDTRWKALAAGLAAARRRYDVSPWRRSLYAAWFVAGAFAPASVAPLLAQAAFQSVRSADR